MIRWVFLLACAMVALTFLILDKANAGTITVQWGEHPESGREDLVFRAQCWINDGEPVRKFAIPSTDTEVQFDVEPVYPGQIVNCRLRAVYKGQDGAPDIEGYWSEVISYTVPDSPPRPPEGLRHIGVKYEEDGDGS